MGKHKPKKKTYTRKQVRRIVGLVRFFVKLGAKQMVDMEHTVGRLVSFDTEEGTVNALTYGFEEPDRKPLLVNLHGSGFVMGSAAMDDPFMMQFVEKCGVKVINIDYPLSPDEMFPSALHKCYALVRYAKAHAETLGIDGDRIMLMGHSAGGNLCAAIGLLENQNPVLGLKGIILDYPPTLIITAGRDSLAEETERFKDTLISAGVDVTFRRFEDAIHGFTVMTEKQSKGREALYRQSLEAWNMMTDFTLKCMA